VTFVSANCAESDGAKKVADWLITNAALRSPYSRFYDRLSVDCASNDFIGWTCFDLVRLGSHTKKGLTTAKVFMTTVMMQNDQLKSD
jgi:hypothetical protein